MRFAVPILSLSVGALVLAGCTATTTDTETSTGDGSCVGVASGSASDAISVVGNFGEEPTVTIDSPVSVDATDPRFVLRGLNDSRRIYDTIQHEAMAAVRSRGVLQVQ